MGADPDFVAFPDPYSEQDLRRAVWSLRLSTVAVPVLTLAGLGHRYGYFDTNALFGLLIVGFGLAFASLILSISALVAIWNEGYRGFSAALRGGLLALIALAPACAGAIGVFLYPRITDITTDAIDPPAISGAANYDATTVDLQQVAYPDIVPRRFTADTVELADAVLKTMPRVGWTIGRAEHPSAEDEPATMTAIRRSLLFAFVDDVTVRITADPLGSRLDIRSRSRVGKHDLGENARQVRAFLTELDAVLIESLGESEPASNGQSE